MQYENLTQELVDRCLSQGADSAEVLLETDLDIAVHDLRACVPGFDDLDDLRQEALVSMIFNLGRGKFMGFQRMRAAIAAEDWERAAREALDSRWAAQVKHRAQEIAHVLRTGQERMPT